MIVDDLDTLGVPQANENMSQLSPENAPGRCVVTPIRGRHFFEYAFDVGPARARG
jgi:hypothetical protein